MVKWFFSLIYHITFVHFTNVKSNTLKQSCWCFHGRDSIARYFIVIPCQTISFRQKILTFYPYHYAFTCNKPINVIFWCEIIKQNSNLIQSHRLLFGNFFSRKTIFHALAAVELPYSQSYLLNQILELKSLLQYFKSSLMIKHVAARTRFVYTCCVTLTKSSSQPVLTFRTQFMQQNPKQNSNTHLATHVCKQIKTKTSSRLVHEKVGFD